MHKNNPIFQRTFPKCRWTVGRAQCCICRCSHRGPLCPELWQSVQAGKKRPNWLKTAEGSSHHWTDQTSWTEYCSHDYFWRPNQKLASSWFPVLKSGGIIDAFYVFYLLKPQRVLLMHFIKITRQYYRCILCCRKKTWK